MDGRILQEWIETARNVRRWRGAILSASFELEYQFDQIISEYFFPGLKGVVPSDASELERFAGATVLKEVFTRTFLEGGALTMGRKLNIVLQLSHQAKQLDPLIRLSSDLHQAIEIRNVFAHGPVFFKAEGDPPNERLIAVLVSRGKETILSDDICAESKNKIVNLCAALSPVLQALSKDPRRLSEGDQVDLRGVIWTMHAGLDSDDWIFDPVHPVKLDELMVNATRDQMTVHVDFEADEESDHEDDHNVSGAAAAAPADD